MEEDGRSIRPKMTLRSRSFATMNQADIQELVWENGQVLHRGLSKHPRINRSCDGETMPDSVSGDSLLGIHSLSKSDQKDNKHNNIDTIFEHDRSCYTKQVLDSQVVPFAKHHRDYDDKHPMDSQVVPFANLKQEDDETNRSTQVPHFAGGGRSSAFFRPPGPLRAENSSHRVLKTPMSTTDLRDTVTNEPHLVPIRMMKQPEPDFSVPDEQSAAIGDDPAYKKRSSNKSRGSSQILTKSTSKEKVVVPSSSICSLEASNNPNYSLKRKCEDTEGSAYFSENDLEEADGVMRAASSRGWKAVKRNRNANVHNQCEKKRRDKINKKMRTLQELVPNGDKVDKAATLDVAIEYIKTLQLQLQMMSMGSAFMAQRMLPTAAPQINAAPHLAYPPDLGRMDMRMQMGLGCYPFQFPTPSLSMAPPPGITDLLGFPGQVLPMSTPHSPLVPFPGMPPYQTVPTFGTSQAAGSMDNQFSAPLELQHSVPLSGLESESKTSSAKDKQHNELAQASAYQARKKQKI